MKWYNGEKRIIMVRRLYCSHCKRLHTELPDVITSRKHYATEIIENVVDDVSTPDDTTTDTYPCERTMQRWKKWIANSRLLIDGYLKSIGSRLSASGVELLNVRDSLLQKLRDDGAGWLSTVSRVIYNTGGWLSPARPHEIYAPALSSCPEPP